MNALLGIVSVIGIGIAVILVLRYMERRIVERFGGQPMYRSFSARRHLEANYRLDRIAVLEHNLMIAGHESECVWCQKKLKDNDHKRELEIAAQHAWSAAAQVDRAYTVESLYAARQKVRATRVSQLPSNPLVGQEFTNKHGSWVYNGSTWELDPGYEWITVTCFGDSEPSYVRGREIA